ncbi:MAG: DUF47 family protein [Methanomassiliicoccales archaeon]
MFRKNAKNSSRRDSDGARGKIVDVLFPPRYDFYKMLSDQAKITLEGVRVLLEWVKFGEIDAPRLLQQIEEKADEMRYDMEGKLMESFVTPFDRQDIYTISRQMDYILNYSLSTALEMKAFGINPDGPIVTMVECLYEGTSTLAEAISLMKRNEKLPEFMIHKMRNSERKIETIYIESMSTIFETDDPIGIIKKREIYHHLKDAGRILGMTIDVLHRIILGIE